MSGVGAPFALCEAAECPRPRRGYGPYCNKHRQRVRKHGDPSHERFALASVRLVSFIDTGDVGQCWAWRGVHSAGYGQFWLDGRMVPAHRAAYEVLVGPIPEGLELDHLCRNTECVNPAHLEPVTHAVNMRRAYAAKRKKKENRP